MDRRTHAPSTVVTFESTPGDEGTPAGRPAGPRSHRHADLPLTAVELAAAARGDRDALSRLATRADKAMRGAAYKIVGPDAHEAEDATQDAWCRLLARPEALAVVQPGTETTWMGAMASLDARNRVARRRVRARRMVNDPEALRSLATPAPDDAGSTRAETEIAWAVFGALPEATRTLLEMARARDMSTREIALALGIPQSTVKDRVRAAERLVVRRVRAAVRALGGK